MGFLDLICPFCRTMLYKDHLFPHGRSARSPLKLVDRFPDHPEIGTLHDNFTWVSLLRLSPFWTQRTDVLCLLLILIIYIAFDLWFYFLHFRRSADVYRDYKYLGTRIRCDGTVGEWVLCYCWISNFFPVVVSIIFDISFHCLRYKWMTYGEASTARTALGSGLVNHGIPKVSDWMPKAMIVFGFSVEKEKIRKNNV